MTIWTIPVQSGTDAFAEQVELDEKVYDLTFRWNARDAHWFLSIGLEGVNLISGIKLVASDDLLAFARRIEHLPSGRLFISDLDGFDRDPDETLFGDRVVLLYDDA